MSVGLGSMFHRQMFDMTAVTEMRPLSLADFDKLVESMREMFLNARAEPDMLLISPRQKKRIVHLLRVGKLYRAHPLPRHKIRKCHMRHVYALRHKGMARIARIERREAQEEAEIMRHIREDSPEDWETYVSTKQSREQR